MTGGHGSGSFYRTHGDEMVRVLASTSLIVVISLPASLYAQSVSFERFDVVSIKRNILGPEAGAGMRTLPDGTLVMTNQPITSIIMSASPVPAREVVGLPDWAMTERYDVTVKPPAGSTREQRRQMWAGAVCRAHEQR
jgi:Protein of unknown function (DUF3738)